MSQGDEAGFTLIELLIVVVLIGILVSIAIPKQAATKDKAKLATVKADVRNIISAEEAYLSDYKVYANWNQLRNRTNTSLSAGNTAAITSNASGFTATVTNNSISKGFKKCQVKLGAGATAGVDGVLVCS